ncbi:MAG: chloride channel protein [Clostridia bacterium]|nr:chloride channel protein [Clostridia bacterium]
MKHKKNIFKYVLSTVLSSAFAGALVGIAIVLFKYCAGHAVHTSSAIYGFIKENPVWAIAAIAAIAIVALLFTLLYRFVPNARGGGIPTSVGILRGVISFHWLENAVSVFFASLATFLIGVPLGTEGPSVQIGTALGKGVSLGFCKKHAALNRYIMTGGASAGFTVATGAPISGIMFALEEAHQRVSPLVLLSTTAAVVSAKTVSELLSPVFGVSPSLFEAHAIAALSPKDFWIPVAVAIVSGFTSVAFLKYYKILNRLWSKRLTKLPPYVKILTVFLLTLAFGLLSDKFISTGHALTEELLEISTPVYFLLICLAIRASVMILATTSGITGGLFLPILALGALVAAICGNVLTALGLSAEYYPVIVMLGITAAVSGMMKMPITAMLFAIESLSLSENILPLIITVAISYLITEIIAVKSITEKVLESRLHHLHGEKKPHVYDTFVTVRENSFAVGKQVRDVLWPSDLIVLSVERANDHNVMADELYEATLYAGDILHLRYPTYNHGATRDEISAIVGSQEYSEERVNAI